MREIKFRAWERLNKKMHLMDLALTDEHGNFATKASVAGAYRTMNLDALEIMQFTGLKDKNGKEIFEGDIVILHYLDAKGDENRVQQSIPVEIKSIWWFAQAVKAYQFTGIEYEIIGNIYENQELLRVA